MYYFPEQPDNSGLTPESVVNVSGSDHADTTTSLSGYTQDIVLGYPWSRVAGPRSRRVDEVLDLQKIPLLR